MGATYRYEVTKDGVTFYRDKAIEVAELMRCSRALVEKNLVGEGEMDRNGYHVKKYLAFDKRIRKDELYDRVVMHLNEFGNTSLDFKHKKRLDALIGELKRNGINVRCREVCYLKKNKRGRPSKDGFYVLEVIK